MRPEEETQKEWVAWDKDRTFVRAVVGNIVRYLRTFSINQEFTRARRNLSREDYEVWKKYHQTW